jgi:hypothetical protein
MTVTTADMLQGRGDGDYRERTAPVVCSQGYLGSAKLAQTNAAAEHAEPPGLVVDVYASNNKLS